VAMEHYEIVKALEGDKSNIGHSLRTLEARGWIVIARPQGRRADSLHLTPEGVEKASAIAMK
jgi:DNA-binding MarR family transcriptional regulator